MKKTLSLLFMSAFIVVNCLGHSPERMETATEQSFVLSPEDINLENRRVFYAIWDNGEVGYYISKIVRLFIVDEKLIIEEIPHEPFNYLIKKIDYQGDSLITAILDNQLIAWEYYSDLLGGEAIRWHEREYENDTDTIKAVFTKDKSTLIWTLTYDGHNARAKFIDSYDILPSGYYYQNQTTTLHDPNNENFLKPERPKLSGVFDLEEYPVEVVVGTEEYSAIEHPYEGTWLELTSTDIGYVVYDYPSLFNDGETHSPITIKIDGNMFTYTFPSDPTEVLEFEEVSIYSAGSFCFKFGDYYHSFKWIDKEKHICQWTQYYEHNNKIDIWQQDYYINEKYNNFPIVIFDWD